MATNRAIKTSDDGAFLFGPCVYETDRREPS